MPKAKRLFQVSKIFKNDDIGDGLQSKESNGQSHLKVAVVSMDDRISEMNKKIARFRDDRDWMQFHDPKNMAISIILEAAELLEHFQWKSGKEIDEHIDNNKLQVEEELADIAIYLFELADNLNIDLLSAMERKIKKNENKYPVAKSKGNAKKYNQF